jgi:hypothetical protein
MEPDPSHSRSPLTVILWSAVILVALLFLPLGIVGAEMVFFHSHHFEDFFRQIGIHEPLGKVYRLVLWFAR